MKRDTIDMPGLVRRNSPLLFLALLLYLPGTTASAASSTLERSRFRKGEETLRAFQPVSDATRNSIVKLNVNGETVALGTVVDAGGLVLTKASELKRGKLTCWLATEKQVDAELLASDETEDLALVHIKATGLKPIHWAEDDVLIGQWAITPGIAATPHAVGIISALPRRIRPARSFIGVQFEGSESMPRIGEVRAGFGAEKAGLKKGDVIVAVNGNAVTNREQIVEMLRDFREGQQIKLRVQRGKEEFDADVGMMRPRADSDDSFFPEERLSRMSGGTSLRAEGFEQAIEHDTVLQPWLCGGPLVNLDGKAMGLNIARASRVTTYALPSKLVRRVLEELKAKSANHSL